PASCNASRAAASASGTVRGTCLRSFTLSCACQSKSRTCAAIFTGDLETSNDSMGDRKSTRLNSSHLVISYAVFCLKKKKENRENIFIDDDKYIVVENEQISYLFRIDMS